MNIIEVTYTWPCETFIQRHISALREHGIDIALVMRQKTSFASSWASIGEENKEFSVFPMPNFDHQNLFNKILDVRHLLARPKYGLIHKPLRNKVQLAFFDRLKPDLIHFHTSSLATAMKWIPNELGIPYTLSLRGSDILISPLRSKKIEEEIVETILEANGVHVVSRYLGEQARKLAGIPFEYSTIYTTIPAPPFLMPYQDIFNETTQLLSVGRLHWSKGLTDLIATIKRLKDKFKLNLTLIGNGPEEERIKYWIKELELNNKIFLAGKYNNNELEKSFPKYHGYIQSSVSEGLSNSLVEAMAWGVPVFATDVGGTSEIINDGENGFILTPYEYDNWADKIMMIQDRSKMEKVRSAAYSTVNTLFNYRNHALKFIEFYKNSLYRERTNYRINKNKEFYIEKTNNNHTKQIVVKGDWIWSNGPDLILKAIASCRINMNKKVLFIGQGAQEDELRHIIKYFKMADSVSLLSASESKIITIDQSATTIDISNAIEDGWKIIENNSLIACVSFGNLSQLKALIQND